MTDKPATSNNTILEEKRIIRVYYANFFSQLAVALSVSGGLTIIIQILSNPDMLGIGIVVAAICFILAMSASIIGGLIIRMSDHDE